MREYAGNAGKRAHFKMTKGTQRNTSISIALVSGGALVAGERPKRFPVTLFDEGFTYDQYEQYRTSI
jgi:hypothetical protein